MCLCGAVQHLFPPLLLKQHRACFTFNLTSSLVLSLFLNCLFFYWLLMEACYVAAIKTTETFGGVVV